MGDHICEHGNWARSCNICQWKELQDYYLSELDWQAANRAVIEAAEAKGE